MLKDVDAITKELEELQERQDRVLGLSRSITRLSGEIVTMLHSKRVKMADSGVKRLKALVKQLSKIEKGFEYNSLQAHQEYIEAYSLYSIIKEGKIPSLSNFREDTKAYLLGVIEVVGELKREAFEELRAGNIKKANYYYEVMKEIYDSLYHIRFANSILPNFRKKQDVARIQLESLSSELLRFGRK